MGLFSSTSDIVVWIGSFVGGIAVLGGAIRFLVTTFENPEKKNILGTWIGYGCFFSRQGDRFYRERVSVYRDRFWPWRLKILARPIGGTGNLAYAGDVKILKSYVYSYTDEPIYGDKTFDLGRYVMDESHGAEMIVGLHLGQSYEQSVHSCCAYLWTRQFLDPNASSESTVVSSLEIAEFNRIVDSYVNVHEASKRIDLTPL